MKTLDFYCNGLSWQTKAGYLQPQKSHPCHVDSSSPLIFLFFSFSTHLLLLLSQPMPQRNTEYQTRQSPKNSYFVHVEIFSQRSFYLYLFFYFFVPYTWKKRKKRSIILSCAVNNLHIGDHKKKICKKCHCINTWCVCVCES